MVHVVFPRYFNYQVSVYETVFLYLSPLSVNAGYYIHLSYTLLVNFTYLIRSETLTVLHLLVYITTKLHINTQHLSAVYNFF